jgi:putative flippase GtrA
VFAYISNLVIDLKVSLTSFSINEGVRFAKFVIVGVVNTAAGYGFYVAYLYIGIPYLYAGTISYATAVCFNYFVTKRYVFDNVARKHSFLYYLLSYGLLYVFSLALLWFFVEVIGLTPYSAGLVAIPFNGVVAFILLKILVFRNIS